LNSITACDLPIAAIWPARSAVQLLLRDIGCELHNLEGFALFIKNRVIARQDPDLLAALADALVFRGLAFAAVETRPEFTVRGAIAHRRLDKDAVMLALDLAKRITECFQEIFVGRNDRAVQIERDHRLRPADGCNHSSIFHAGEFLSGDVRRKLDNSIDLAIAVEHGIVGGLNPDLLAALADALESRGLVLAPVEVSPEFTIGGAVAHRRLDKHAVMLALDLAERITERLQKIFVCGDNRAIQIELDYSLRLADRFDLRQRRLRDRIASREHLKIPLFGRKMMNRDRHGRFDSNSLAPP